MYTAGKIEMKVNKKDRVSRCENRCKCGLKEEGMCAKCGKDLIVERTGWQPKQKGCVQGVFNWTGA